MGDETTNAPGAYGFRYISDIYPGQQVPPNIRNYLYFHISEIRCHFTAFDFII